MGSPIQWLIAVVVVGAIYLPPIFRLLQRTGHNGWWALFFFVPFVNLIGLWVWAFESLQEEGNAQGS